MRIHTHTATQRVVASVVPIRTGSKHREGPRHRHAETLQAKAAVVAAAPSEVSLDQGQESLRPKRLHRRCILVAVDGTAACLDGLRWLHDNLFRDGDTVHLVSVVNNDRAQPVAVGSSSPGQHISSSLDEAYDFGKSEEYGQRLVNERMSALASSFQPVARQTGVSVQCSVNTVPGSPSAASIADSLCNSAKELNADMLVVTSHGGGLKCSYGSVARYCISHFNRAILILPTVIASHLDASAPSLSVGINHTQEVQDAFSWGIDYLFKDGDKLNVLHSAESSIEKRSTTDQYAIMAGVREQCARHAVKEMCYLKTSPKASELEGKTAEQLNKLCAQSLLQRAAEKNTRALVMVNYATQGLMQEMMFGSLAMFVSRESPLPLALVPRGYATE